MNVIKKDLEITKTHLDRLKKKKQEIIEKNIFDNLNIDYFKKIVKILDIYIFRFTKLQDYFGQKLFRRFLNLIKDYYEYISFLDILDKLEKLGIIYSVEN